MEKKKVVTQICLAWSIENQAGEDFCRNCGKALRISQQSRRKNILEIIAILTIFFIIMVIVSFVISSLF